MLGPVVHEPPTQRGPRWSTVRVLASTSCSYHERRHQRRMLEHLERALKLGGRLVLVEPFPPARHSEPRESHGRGQAIAPERVKEDLK